MRLFFDMDGVLAVYETSAYHAPADGVAAFVDPDRHYYRDCLADERMVKVARKLVERKLPVAYLTKVHADAAVAMRQIYDKRDWLDSQDLIVNNNGWRPGPGRDDREPTGTFIACMCCDDYPTKADWLTNVLGCRPHAGDVLIDDRNEELQSWKRAGGVPIKYCNGYSNSADSWNGLSITDAHTADDIEDMLLNIGFAQQSIASCTHNPLAFSYAFAQPVYTLD